MTLETISDFNAEPLRRALVEADRDDACGGAETVWRAVAGELSRSETRDVLEHSGQLACYREAIAADGLAGATGWIHLPVTGGLLRLDGSGRTLLAIVHSVSPLATGP